MNEKLPLDPTLTPEQLVAREKRRAFLLAQIRELELANCGMTSSSVILCNPLPSWRRIGFAMVKRILVNTLPQWNEYMLKGLT